jgi:hypothetical protein
MSKEVKVARLASEIRSQNEKNVIEFTCNAFKIIGMESPSFSSGNFSNMQRDMMAHSIYVNLISFDKNGPKWEDGQSTSTSKIVTAISNRIKEGENSCKTIGAYLDTKIKFSFEKAIPTVQR